MDPASRINYAKLYTVEHSVKVYDFGDVYDDHFLALLVEQWKWVLNTDNTTKAGPVYESGVTALKTVNTRVATGTTPQDSTTQSTQPTPEPTTKDAVSWEYGIASFAWNDEKPGQLKFRQGDRILVTGYLDDNWGKGRNERTHKEGIFPRNYVAIETMAPAGKE